jgi:hypothetical protein
MLINSKAKNGVKERHKSVFSRLEQAARESTNCLETVTNHFIIMQYFGSNCFLIFEVGRMTSTIRTYTPTINLQQQNFDTTHTTENNSDNTDTETKNGSHDIKFLIESCQYNARD